MPTAVRPGFSSFGFQQQWSPISRYRGRRTKRSPSPACGVHCWEPLLAPTVLWSEAPRTPHRLWGAACGMERTGSGSVPTPPTWFAGCALGPLETLQKPCGGCGVDTPGSALVRRRPRGCPPQKCTSHAGDSRNVNLKTFKILCYGDSLTVGFCRNGSCFEPYGQTLLKELKARRLGFDVQVGVVGNCGLQARQLAGGVHNPSLRDTVGNFWKGLALQMADDHQLVIIMAGRAKVVS